MVAPNNERKLNNEQMHQIVRTLLNTTDVMNNSELNNAIYGDNYYDNLSDVGVAGLNQSVGTPTNNTINRYYDEKRNYSVLAPTLDPLAIMNLSRRAKQALQTNDWSESYFFTSLFDQDEIIERWKEKTLVYSKRLEWKRINEIKRRPAFMQLIGINLLILDKLDNLLRYATKHYIHDKIEQTPKGRSFYVKSVFVNGASPTKIDFTDLTKCKNFPSSFNYYNFPSTELFSILVRCDSGGPIQIATNEEDDSMRVYLDLAAGEEHKIDNAEATIKSVNLKANGSDATVRVIGLY